MDSDSESDYSDIYSDSDDIPLSKLIKKSEKLDSESDSDSENESEISVDQSSSWKVNDRTERSKDPFAGPQPGATVDLDPEQTEYDFFEMFFLMVLFELLVEQTNLYAKQKTSKKADKLWRPVTLDEMKAYLGIRVSMSILQVYVVNILSKY